MADRTQESSTALSAESAQRLTDKIRSTAQLTRAGLVELQILVEEAKAGNAHETLGYASWTAYLADVLGGAPMRLPREQRQELVGYLAGEGMSTRAIAPIVGASQRTVSDDVRATEQDCSVEDRPEMVTSLDGRERPSRQPRPEPVEPEPDLSKLIRDRHRADQQEKTAEKRAGFRERTEALAAKEIPLPDRRYSVLYADPPWRYDFAETENRAIENHYPTMTAEDIAAMEIPATDDAVLFMWATNPKLTEAFQVLEGWGFNYVTNMVWVKDKIGMGYYARSRHELLFIAKRGTPPVPEPGDRPDSVISAPRTKHSAKPVEAYELIERMYPGLPKLEMFCRSPREGWDGWGNEA